VALALFIVFCCCVRITTDYLHDRPPVAQHPPLINCVKLEKIKTSVLTEVFERRTVSEIAVAHGYTLSSIDGAWPFLVSCFSVHSTPDYFHHRPLVAQHPPE
jgi:hypothetical protein